MKSLPDQKVERALDQALADTFPASDPIACLQPTAAGLGPPPPGDRKDPLRLGPVGKEALRRAVGY